MVCLAETVGMGTVELVVAAVDGEKWREGSDGSSVAFGRAAKEVWENEMPNTVGILMARR